MSFAEDWVLPNPAESYSTDDLLARLRKLLPVGVVATASGDTVRRTFHVTFAVAQVEAVAQMLSSRPGQLAWDWRAELEPPRFGLDYVVHLDVLEDERPILRASSNDGENRAAWPLVSSMASSLAEDLGAVPEEDAPPPSERLPLFIEPGKGRLLN